MYQSYQNRAGIYHAFGLKGRKIAEKLKRGHEEIYRVIRQLKLGLTAMHIHLQYRANKAKCDHKRIQLSIAEKSYINDKVRDGWIPDVIIGRNEDPFLVACARFIECFKQVNSIKNIYPCKANANQTAFFVRMVCLRKWTLTLIASIYF